MLRTTSASVERGRNRYFGLGLALLGSVLILDGAHAADDPGKRGEVYARFMRAVLAEQHGDYREAATEVRRATETMPRTPEVLVEGARLLSRMGRLEEAESLAERALTIDAEDRDALMLLADAAATRAIRAGKSDAENRDRALGYYDRLLALGPLDADSLRRVIQLRLDAGDRTGAIAAARLLVADKPGDAHAVGLLAQLLIEDEKNRDALEVLLAFLSVHPDDSPLIRVAQELARELEAWDLVAQSLAEPSGGSASRALDLQRLRGEALLRLDRVEPASEVLADLAARDPEDRAVRYHLARTYRRLGRLGEAADLVRDLAAEEDPDGRMRLLLAEILDDQGADLPALVEYRAVLTRLSEPDDLEVRDAIRRRVAILELERGRIEAAGDSLTGLEAPDTAESVHARARLDLASEAWEAARDAARTLRSLGDLGTSALVDAEALLRSGRASRAEPRIEEAIEALGPGARVRVAELYHELGMEEQGLAVLRAWIAADPDSAEAHFHVGSYLSRAGRTADAEAELREAFRIDPAHAGALNFLGYSWAESGAHLEEAMSLIRRALEVDPWNGAYLDSLGWVLFQMGRYGEAREPLEQAARTFPYDATVLEHQGDLYARLGEDDAAIASWERALAASPERASELRAKIRGQSEHRQAAADPSHDATEPGVARGAGEPSPRP